MFRLIGEILNWFLAIWMWLVIGRAVLDRLTPQRRTPIHRPFHALTRPLYRVAESLFPRLRPTAKPLLIVVFLLILRLALLPLLLP